LERCNRSPELIKRHYTQFYYKPFIPNKKQTMKKMLFFAAIAATVLATGCSKEEGAQTAVNEANAIVFRGIVNKSTRATAVSGLSELTNFFVEAGQHANGTAIADLDFLSASVYKDGTSWAYSPLKYYPSNGDEVDFYAYAPVKDVNMTTDLAIATGVAQFGYTVPYNQKVDNTAVDLLVASAVNKTAPAVAAPMAFTFNHALSGVTFSAANRNATSGAGSELTYVISDIKITKLYNVGTFNYPFSATSWAPGTLAPRTDAYVAGLPEAGVALPAIGPLPAAAQNLLSANDIMMVLPQTVTVGTFDTDGVTPLANETFVEVTYSLKDGAGVPVFTNIVRKLALPTGFKFEAGKLYNFSFDFGTSSTAMSAISFTVTALTAWDPVAETL
jgi:hypothetical protein